MYWVFVIAAVAGAIATIPAAMRHRLDDAAAVAEHGAEASRENLSRAAGIFLLVGGLSGLAAFGAFDRGPVALLVGAGLGLAAALITSEIFSGLVSTEGSDEDLSTI